MIHLWVVDLQMPVHGHDHLVTVPALLLLHLLPLVPVGYVQVQVEHVIGSVVTELTMFVFDLQVNGIYMLVHTHLMSEHLGTMGAGHISFSLEACPTLSPQQVGF